MDYLTSGDGVRYVPNLTLFLWVRVRGSARALIIFFFLCLRSFLPCMLIDVSLALLAGREVYCETHGGGVERWVA